MSTLFRSTLYRFSTYIAKHVFLNTWTSAIYRESLLLFIQLYNYFYRSHGPLLTFLSSPALQSPVCLSDLARCLGLNRRSILATVRNNYLRIYSHKNFRLTLKPNGGLTHRQRFVQKDPSSARKGDQGDSLQGPLHYIRTM